MYQIQLGQVTMPLPEKLMIQKLWELGETPIKVAVLINYLNAYPVQLANQLIKGFKKGFKLHYIGPT